MERLASLDTEDTRLLRTHSDPEEVSQQQGHMQSEAFTSYMNRSMQSIDIF